MSVKEFVDTNVLIYGFDRTAGKKRELAIELIERLWDSDCGCLNLQVLQEFYVTATKKLGMSSGAALAQVERLGRWTVHRPRLEDIVLAIQTHHAKRISFWDALILRSATASGCSILWSEDLSDGQRWDGVTVRNPF